MLARYSRGPIGPSGSLRPLAYASSACRVVPLAASNIPTAWRNSASRESGTDSSAGGAARRASSRGSTSAGRA